MKWLFYGADDFHLFICDALFLRFVAQKNQFIDWLMWFQLFWKCSHRRVQSTSHPKCSNISSFWIQETRKHTDAAHALGLLLLLCWSISVQNETQWNSLLNNFHIQQFKMHNLKWGKNGEYVNKESSDDAVTFPWDNWDNALVMNMKKEVYGNNEDVKNEDCLNVF